MPQLREAGLTLNPTIRTVIVWVAIFVVVILLYNTFQTGKMNRQQITFSEFMEDISRAGSQR